MSIVALKRKTSATRNISHNKTFSLGHRNIYTSRKCCANIVNTHLNTYRHTQQYWIHLLKKNCLSNNYYSEHTDANCVSCPNKSIRYPVLLWKKNKGATSYDMYYEEKWMRSNC